MENTMTTTEKALSIKNIWTEPIEFKGNRTDFYGVTDGTELYGVVSKRYQPVTHAKVLSNVREFLPECEIVNTYAERLMRRVVFNIRLPKVYELNGEGIQTFINLSNSLDGSWKVGIVVSPVNVICRNTYILSIKEAFINISRKHTRAGVQDFFYQVPKVEQIYNALEGQLEVAQSLLDLPCTTAKGRDFLGQLVTKKVIGMRQAEKIGAHLVRPQFRNEEPSSFLGVYNAVTNVMSRDLEQEGSLSTLQSMEEVGEAFAELVSVR